jgi:membrane protease YdiL (CAAX protease family)
MLKRIATAEEMPPWGYLFALGAFMVMFLGIIIGSTVMSLVFPDGSPSVLLVGWGIGMTITIIYVLTSRRQSPDDIEALRMGATNTKLLIIALWSVGFAILFDLISWAVVNTQVLSTAELFGFVGGDISAMSWLIAGIFMILLQPLAEELVFRGLMFPAFRGMFGVWVGFWMVIIFHTLFHFLAYLPVTSDNTIILWYGAGLPFLHATFITAVRGYTGSTRAAWVAHAVFGAFAIIKTIIFA